MRQLCFLSPFHFSGTLTFANVLLACFPPTSWTTAFQRALPLRSTPMLSQQSRDLCANVRFSVSHLRSSRRQAFLRRAVSGRPSSVKKTKPDVLMRTVLRLRMFCLTPVERSPAHASRGISWPFSRLRPLFTKGVNTLKCPKVILSPLEAFGVITHFENSFTGCDPAHFLAGIPSLQNYPEG